MGRQNDKLIENMEEFMRNNNKLNKMEEITEEQFEAYKDVQQSGVTNMFDVKTVGQLSGLEKEEIMIIMKSYNELKEKYND